MFDMRVKWKWSIFIPIWTRWTDSGDSKGKTKISIFLERQTYFEEELHDVFTFNKPICTQKKSEIVFSSLAEEIRFCPIFVEIVS